MSRLQDTKVGDEVLIRERGGVYRSGVVDRATTTRLVVGPDVFVRQTGRRVGISAHVMSAEPMTDEARERWRESEEDDAMHARVSKARGSLKLVRVSTENFEQVEAFLADIGVD